MTNKQYPPSLKKIKKAKTEGNIPKSTALTSFVSLTIGILTIFLSYEYIWEYLIYLVKLNSYQVNTAFQISYKNYIFLTLFLIGLFITPIVGASLLSTWGQNGFCIVFRKKPIQQNLFSQSLGTMLHNIKTLWISILVLITVGIWIFLHYPLLEPIKVWWWLIIVLCFFSLIEYAVKRYTWYKGLMMTHQELKEEHKDSEGDPHAKAYRRVMQRAMSMQSLEERVKRAKVIVVARDVRDRNQEVIQH